MIANAIHVWNLSQTCHQNVAFHHLSANKLKEILVTVFPKQVQLAERFTCINNLSNIHKINLL